MSQEVPQLEDGSITAWDCIKDAFATVAPGLTWDNIIQDVGAEADRLMVQGTMELASGLFNGNAFVPYGPGQYTPSYSPSPELGMEQEAIAPPEQEMDRGGMGM